MSTPVVEYDAADGAVTVTVSSDFLADFPKFMNYVIRNKIGEEQGVFKVRITDASETTLDSLCRFCTDSLKKIPDTVKVHPLQQQIFYYGSSVDDVYGFQNSDCSDAQFKRFLEKLSDTTTFQKVANCCTKALDDSLHKYEDHIWNNIHRASKPGCAVRRERNVKQLIEAASSHRQEFYFDPEQQAKWASSNVNLSRQRSKGWKSKHEAILYTSGLRPEKLPGLTYGYMYVGKSHAGFSWHIEDAALFSANFLHFGAPSIWYFVAPKYYSQFVNCLKYFPLDLGHTSCYNVLGHKYVFASKEYLKKFGIPVQTIIQREKELLVIYPFAAHMGFKTGWNISEAINFADPFWVEPAIFSPTCVCFKYQIHLDLKEMVALTRPDLLPMYLDKDYLGLARVLQSNKFLSGLGVLQHLLLDETSADVKVFVPDSKLATDDNTEIGEPPQLPPADIKTPNPDVMDIAIGENVPDEEDDWCTEEKPLQEKVFKGARYTLTCPGQGCNKTFEGGRCKLARMRSHIKKYHNKHSKQLLQKLEEENPRKVCTTAQLRCPSCKELKTGTITHMHHHYRRKHPEEQLPSREECL